MGMIYEDDDEDADAEISIWLLIKVWFTTSSSHAKTNLRNKTVIK